MEESKEVILEKDIYEDISRLNVEVNKYQKEIFKILLKISKSFSIKKTTRQDRDEMFEEVDKLKEKVKECNKKIKENNNIIKQKKENNNIVQEEINKKIKEEKNEDLSNELETLENNIKKIESIKDENKNVEKQENECKIIPLAFIDNAQSADSNAKNNQLMVLEKENKSIISKIFKKIKAFFKK